MTTSESPRVICADDDAAFLDLGGTYLRKLSSFGVTTRLDPRVAFDIVRDFDIDCVASDYDMPVMAEVELLETVREDHGLLLLIFFIGRGGGEVVGDAISAGITNYFQKQPSFKQYELLVNRIENSVSEHRTTRRVERYETILRALGYPIYVVGECGRFEYVNDTFIDHGGSEVTVTIGRTHDDFYVEDDGDGLSDDRSPKKCSEAGGGEHRNGGLTRRRRLNF